MILRKATKEDALAILDIIVQAQSYFKQNKGSNVITDETKNNSNIETNATNNYIKTIVGRNNSKIGAEVLNDIKNNLFNIDILKISELSDLFMGVM